MPSPHHTVLIMVSLPALVHKALLARIEAMNTSQAEASKGVYCGQCGWQGSDPKPDRCPECKAPNISKTSHTPWTIEAFIIDELCEELGIPTESSLQHEA